MQRIKRGIGKAKHLIPVQGIFVNLFDRQNLDTIQHDYCANNDLGGTLMSKIT